MKFIPKKTGNFPWITAAILIPIPLLAFYKAFYSHKHKRDFSLCHPALCHTTSRISKPWFHAFQRFTFNRFFSVWVFQTKLHSVPFCTSRISHSHVFHNIPLVSRNFPFMVLAFCTLKDLTALFTKSVTAFYTHDINPRFVVLCKGMIPGQI